MEYKSTQKFILVSPKKLREVADLIRKLTPNEAIEKLPFVPKRAARHLEKVVRSAVANAKQKGVDIGKLSFKEIEVSEGPRLKRYRAGARGRVKPYKRRMSHIRVVLQTIDDLEVKGSKSNLTSEKKGFSVSKSLTKKG